MFSQHNGPYLSGALLPHINQNLFPWVFFSPALVGFFDPKEIIVKLFTAHCITEAPRLIILDSQGTIVHENARGGASVFWPF